MLNRGIINVPCEVVSVYPKAGRESVVAGIVIGDCQEPLICVGDVITVDKELQPADGRFVVCEKDRHEIVKRYLLDGQGKPHLVDNYGQDTVDGYRIKGLVVEVIKRLGFSLGAVDYFVKPIDKKRFLARIAELGLAAGHEVLVVDDNPADVRLVSSILEAGSIRVLRAYSGEEGLMIAREKKPALIVLDILMPDLSGFEVIGRLREDEKTRDIPIIILTVKDLSEEEYEVLNKQTEAVMKKTDFKREDFLSEVKRAANLDIK